MFSTWDRSLSSEGQVELEATVGNLSISGLIEMGLLISQCDEGTDIFDVHGIVLRVIFL
jgi:hypothetical protein